MGTRDRDVIAFWRPVRSLNRMLCKHDVIVKPILLKCELHIKNTENRGGQAMEQSFTRIMFLWIEPPNQTCFYSRPLKNTGTSFTSQKKTKRDWANYWTTFCQQTKCYSITNQVKKQVCTKCLPNPVKLSEVSYGWM